MSERTQQPIQISDAGLMPLAPAYDRHIFRAAKYIVSRYGERASQVTTNLIREKLAEGDDKGAGQLARIAAAITVIEDAAMSVERH
jgi:hypothetical protein